jgi:two-component system sensor histidine kinase KdpD
MKAHFLGKRGVPFRPSFRLSLKDSLTTVVAIAVSASLCGFLGLFSSSDIHVPLIFVLTVLIVSRLTEGYFYGIFTSVVAVFGVNYVFTYPYFAFNFTISGYPVTFLTMLAVSVITSTLTTQIKQQEKLRVETEKEKLRANLLRAISHDLRTPLTSIVGSTSAVLEGENLFDDQKRALLQEVRDDALWLIRMVENLLFITRMGGEAVIHKQPEVLEELIGSAVYKFRKSHPGMSLRVSIPAEPIFIPADVILIEQVLMNLMENAVVHGKTLTRIDLSVVVDDKKKKKKGKKVTFSVENDGERIDENVLPHLFDGHYARADKKGEAGSKRNMGIGLSVCTSIVKAHCGEISAENLPGGVRFRFSLPLEGSASHVP